MQGRHPIRNLARPIEIFTVISILLLSVFILEEIILGIERIIIISRTVRTQEDTLPRDAEITLEEKINRSKKEFLPDGTIFLVYGESKKVGSERQVTAEVYDANQKLVWQGVADVPYKEYLLWHNYYDDRGWYMRRYGAIKPDFSKTLDFEINSGTDGGEIWRYDFSRGCFTGYTINRGKIGYIGSNGFSTTKEEVSPFDKLIFYESNKSSEQIAPSTLLWLTDHQVSYIDLEKRQVNVILNTPDSRIKGFSLGELPNLKKVPAIKYRFAMDFVTEDNIHHLLLSNPRQELNVSLPKDCLGENVNIAFTATENDIFFKLTGTDQQMKERRKWVGLYKVNETGSLEQVNRFEWTAPAREVKGPTRLVSKPYVTALSPCLYDWLWRGYGEKILNFDRHRSTPLSAILGIIKESRPVNCSLNLFLGIAMMGIIFWHGWARRTSWARLIFWVILVVMFNLAGLLTYLSLNHTAVIKCPVCGKKRGLERSDCVRCGNPLPAPQRKPTDLIINA